MEFWRRKKEKGKARKLFLENGSMFLEQLIANCNGISNPIRMFSSDQISKATNHFDPKFSLPDLQYKYSYSGFTWYKGVIDCRSYLIKRFTGPLREKEEHAYNDIVLSARVSNHIGFLRLIGCCLEFPHPVLVFEDLEYRSLNHRGSVGFVVASEVLPWNVRLKIAKEVAVSITYLHTAFPRTIIHREICATNVFLDKNGTAKLTNLALAVTLPEGESWIEELVMGILAHADPMYASTAKLTEYLDVYCFGIFMLVLLLGRPVLLERSDGRFDFRSGILEHVKDLKERGEPVEFGGDSSDMKHGGQMKMFLHLALRCCEKRNEDRPEMISVAKQIKLIEQASPDSEMLENGSEDGQI